MNILAQDWIAASILTVALFAYFETLGPFFRQFRLDDASLQHPFAYHERVSDTKLYLVSYLLPSALIIAAQTARRRFALKAAPTAPALLGLVLAIAATGITTDVLKVWIANPRPDFLARCGAGRNPCGRICDCGSVHSAAWADVFGRRHETDAAGPSAGGVCSHVLRVFVAWRRGQVAWPLSAHRVCADGSACSGCVHCLVTHTGLPPPLQGHCAWAGDRRGRRLVDVQKVPWDGRAMRIKREE
ncbi:hypothetical protein CLUG_04907 [Clavispora lusitaniae ATCC 42720]|uniref:Phosphatidic acid phosphatase type 2/haloperoxidase domain-containing protein n=1 Tax=Clavispora lusitaniae (strain ATCC 42720) TaxID=306902 RepID=C4Y9L7_CLAL4|nr:uncharacterized protein CLUG_04907 [Clavispora lusitaniae ATCC 42720]EEQ40780.1 hypothetical protein CLUG_04907 [Clavispora lusitaniae ATCC 42720]